jgi:hypothetical protein
MSAYSKLSPYFTTPVLSSYLDILNIRNIPESPDDVFFTVTQQYTHRPDLLAYDLYGNVNLWWVFAVRNKNILKDPVFDLVAGQQIYLPTQTSLNNSIGI